MTLSRNDALQQQLDAIEAALNTLTGARIDEVWLACPVDMQRPDSAIGLDWLKACGIEPNRILIIPHRSPALRRDICFVHTPGFVGEFPEPWTLVEYPAISGDKVRAWTHPVINREYREWRGSR